MDFDLSARRFRRLLILIAAAVAVQLSCFEPSAVIIPPPAGFQYSACPDGMIFIPSAAFDYGPSDPERSGAEPVSTHLPAFCIDRLPVQDASDGPKRRLTYFDAVQTCAARGDGYRLCGEMEWERACRGDRLFAYPYGKQFEPGRCDAATDAPIGSSSRCISAFGVIGLTDGAGEWTLGGEIGRAHV